MKILITGHKGFIGSTAVTALSDKHEIDTWDWSNNWPDIKGYDWIMHFGAITSTVERDVEKVLHQNLDFSIWLIEECNKHGVNLQYSSSASVYGLNQEFKEDSPVDPRTPYAWSKYLFERYVKSKSWNITHQGFRYFNVYGDNEGRKGNQASPYYKFTQQAETFHKIIVFDNSDRYRRDFVHVDRVIEVQEKFLNIEQSGLWNIGSGQAKSFLEIAIEIGTRIPSIISHVPMPNELRSSYQEYTCADLTLLNKTLYESNG
jgi:ADP-L-glycero-D-manno-heptose 6-epimerase